MTYYGDTSWWLALLYRGDIHHTQAIKLLDSDPERDILWTPWQRVEVFNGLHQMERLRYLMLGEARQAIRRVEQNVYVGRWRHIEFSWIDATRKACHIAETLGPTLAIRGMDLFHVAVALTVRAEAFVTFDGDQAQLAMAAGLTLAVNV